MMNGKEIIKEIYNHSSEQMTKMYICEESTEVENNVIRVIVLDISGMYAQIYDQGYFDKNGIDNIKQKYSDKAKWVVLAIA